METLRTEYPAMLDSLEPSKAVNLLNDRVKHVGKLNSEIADWLMERRRIEELYVSNLRKLAQKQPPDDTSDLGVFTTPWQKIISSAASLADSHQILAQRIEAEIETPLRNYASTNREMQAMSTMQGNLQSLAKDLEGAQKKSDKLISRGGKADANKVANASSDMDNASLQWTTQAPYVFEALQALDEGRCNQLRDILTQYETFEVDLVERNRKAAEKTLNSLLNVETSDEIRTFVLKSTGSNQQRPERRSSRAPPSSSSALAPPIIEERASQQTPSASEEKKSRLSGLKRLGTVVSRRRQSTQPPIHDRSSGVRGSNTSLGANARSNGDRPVMSRDESSGSLGDVRPPPGPPPTSRYHGIESTPTPGIAEEPSSPPINSSAGQRNYTNGAPQSQSLTLQEPLQPQNHSVQNTFQATSRDADGFSVPPPPSDPISYAEHDGSSFADSISTQPKVLLRDEPIPEDQEEAESAMATVANKLREQAAPPRRATTQRGRRDVRNTVFLASPPQLDETRAFDPSASTTSNLSTSTSPALFATPFVSSIMSGQSPLSTSIPQGYTAQGEDHVRSDSQSTKSARSTSTSAAVVKHPELQSAGLSSSVIETVSAWLDHGAVTRAVVIGEMALAYNASVSSPGPQIDTIRLENFSALEKVAPNPSFISQLGGDHPGEYGVDLTAIPRTSVAFKYQVHLDSSAYSAQAPLILTPTWKVEPSQTSVILAYSLNPTIAAPVTLTNAVIAIHIDGKSTTCLSKPTGTFSKERGLIYWRLDSVTLTPGDAPQKLLARFATMEEAKPGRVEAKWEVNTSEGTGIGSGLGISRMESGGSDPFADQEDAPVGANWSSVECVRKLISGTYIAN